MAPKTRRQKTEKVQPKTEPPKSEHPNFDLLQSGDRDRQVAFFKKALRFQESAAGVVIQRVPASEVHRIMKPVIQKRQETFETHKKEHMKKYKDEEKAEAFARKKFDALRIEGKDFLTKESDYLQRAIFSMQTTFQDSDKKGVEIFSAVESLAYLWSDHRSKGNGCLLLAWKSTFDKSKTPHQQPPKLVGAMTLHKFVETELFSIQKLNDTTKEKLRPYFEGEYMYIDAMCSVAPGVGKVMVLHAIRWALMRKCEGIVALSFSTKKDRLPESIGIFEKFKFDPICCNAPLGLKWRKYTGRKPPKEKKLSSKELSRALTTKLEFTPEEWVKFNIKNLKNDHVVEASGGGYFQPVDTQNDAGFKAEEGMYGRWFVREFGTIDFSGIMKEAIEICTRMGIRKKESLTWRCPQ